MKTALVTGGTGRIGIELANKLVERGYSVTLYDRALNNYKKAHESINFELSDIRTLTPLSSFDYIYHLASHLSDNKEYDAYNDIISTMRIVSSYPESRVIFTSSLSASDPYSYHGITKKSCEHYLNLHKNSVSVRFGEVFGEGQGNKWIKYFIDTINNGHKASVPGDSKKRSEMIYIHDIVDSLIKIGESKIKGQTDTGYGATVKPLDLYKLIVKIMGKKENYLLVNDKKKAGLIHTIKFRIREPKYGFLVGLRNTVRHYLEEGIIIQNGSVESKGIHRVRDRR